MGVVETVKELLLRILQDIKNVHHPNFDSTNRTEALLDGLIKRGHVKEKVNHQNDVMIEYELTESGMKFMQVLENVNLNDNF